MPKKKATVPPDDPQELESSSTADGLPEPDSIGEAVFDDDAHTFPEAAPESEPEADALSWDGAPASEADTTPQEQELPMTAENESEAAADVLTLEQSGIAAPQDASAEFPQDPYGVAPVSDSGFSHEPDASGGDIFPPDPRYDDLLRELGSGARPQDANSASDPEAPLEVHALDLAGEAQAGETVSTGGGSILPEDSGGAASHVESTRKPEADRDDYVLTIDARDRVPSMQDQAELIWHEIRTSHITGRILTGTLDGVEQTESGMTIVVVDYKGCRVAIPIREMMLHTGPIPYGAAYYSLMDRLNRILATMLGAEIDFIVRGIDKASRSVVASRRAAMLRKRQTFYMDTNEANQPMIYEGRVVQARVVGVAEKVLRVEVFGVECAIFARDLSSTWLGDARDQFSVGDRVLVRVKTIDRPDISRISITADIRSVSGSTSHDNLKKVLPQSRYAGQVTDVRNGVVFVRLNNGANAIAHTCLDRRMPGKKDNVSFAVTRLDEERGVAFGIITRIIKQNL